MAALRFINRALSALAILAVRGYQCSISRLLPPSCRYEPSCSQYMIDAIERKGPFVGVWIGIRRVLRCHPFNPGGHDPVG